MANASIDFFEAQFQRQLRQGELALNPFEQAALAHVRGDMLDYGCGLGNLALAAARRGCRVLALDASATAIAHLQEVAAREHLPLEAREADLRSVVPEGRFDTIACIGLLMFFDCATAQRQLERVQALLRPGGVLVLNVLVRGTTYLGMFDAAGHCLFEEDALLQGMAGWQMLHQAHQEFDAPGGTRKAFLTLIARKPG